MASRDPRTYRTMPARVFGGVIVIAAVVLAVVLGIGEWRVGNNPATPAGVMLVVIVVSWIFLLRPCVVIGPESVTLRNLLTDVVVPYARLDHTGQQWSLELVDNAGTRHSAWAIPMRRELRPRKNIDRYAEATTRGKAAEGNHAEVLSGRVEQALQTWKLEGGVSEPGVGSRPIMAWAAVGPAIGAGAVALLTFLLG